MGDGSDDADDETLIAYVRGSLPSKEADRISSEAARRPELQAEIALMRGVAAALYEDAKTPVPGDLGWARLSRALDAEPSRPALPIRRPLWQLAASAAAAVLIWQIIAAPYLLAPDDAEYVPVTETAAEAFTLSVAFAPTATEEAIRALLQEIDAQVVGGPSAIGLWRVRFETGSARDAGLLRLQSIDIVESAQRQ